MSACFRAWQIARAADDYSNGSAEPPRASFRIRPPSRASYPGHPMSTSERLILEFADAAAFMAWLEDNHATTPEGLWIRHAKKATGIPSVTHAEALELCLCFGWIDAQRLPHDATHYLQRYTPRRPRSKWSQRNRTAATELIAQGRMRPAGLAQVEAA